MEKNIFFFISLISLVFIIKCSELPLETWENNLDYDELDSDHYFKESLKEYLEEHKLIDSEKIIQPEEMKKIFLDVVSDDDPDGTTDYMLKMFEELADHFVNLYYKERKEIRGKDIYDLIDINPISMKFEELMGNSPYFPGFNNEEENDFDNMDDVGDPTFDV